MWCKDVLEQLNNAILMSKGFFNLLKEVYVQLLYNSFRETNPEFVPSYKGAKSPHIQSF